MCGRGGRRGGKSECLCVCTRPRIGSLSRFVSEGGNVIRLRSRSEAVEEASKSFRLVSNAFHRPAAALSDG